MTKSICSTINLLWLLKSLGKSTIDLLYPPLCLHCNESLENDCFVFCQSCLSTLEKIDPLFRCPTCFSAEYNPEIEKMCLECRQKKRNIQKIASVFDYEGVAATFIKQLKYGGKPYLAKGGGAYLAAQFIALEWPIPDVVIPMPMSRLRRFERGYNQSELLALSFTELIGSSFSLFLRRRGGDFSQAGLEHNQRLLLKSDSFFVKKGVELYDQTVLLIDDVMTTGSSLNCCAEALIPLFPKSIYALTLCRTIT